MNKNRSDAKYFTIAECEQNQVSALALQASSVLGLGELFIGVWYAAYIRLALAKINIAN